MKKFRKFDENFEGGGVKKHLPLCYLPLGSGAPKFCTLVVTLNLISISSQFEHCTKLWVGHAKLGRQVKRAMVIQLLLRQRQFFRTPHDQTPEVGLGAQDSVGMWILRVTTNVQNLRAPDPKGR